MNVINIFRNPEALEIQYGQAFETQYGLYEKAFADCKNLDSLKFCHIIYDLPLLSDILRNSVKRMSLLKTFQASGSFFAEDVPLDVTFKLTELVILEVDSEVRHQNTNLFLKTQSDTLEILKIDYHLHIDAEFLKIVLLMPRLRKLTLETSRYQQMEPVIEKLPESHSITDLSLFYINGYDELTNLLRAFPKVENLKIKKLDDEIMKAMLKTCKFSTLR